MSERIVAWIAVDQFVPAGEPPYWVSLQAERADGTARLVGEHNDQELDGALRWAREQTSFVLLRDAAGAIRSAGSVNPDPDLYPEWLGDARPVRKPFPNTGKWEVRMYVAPNAAATVSRALAADTHVVSLLEAPPEASQTVRIVIAAPDIEQAHAIADALHSRHVAAANVPLEPRYAPLYELYPFTPD